MKGSADLITLVIGAVPMILLLIIASFIIAERNVSADLNSEMAYSETAYRTQVAAAQVMSNEEFREDLGLKAVNSGRSINQQRVHKILSNYSSNYRFISDDVEISGQTTGSTTQMSMFVASPSTDPVRARFRVGGPR